jgi:hypothetical protein
MYYLCEVKTGRTTKLLVWKINFQNQLTPRSYVVQHLRASFHETYVHVYTIYTHYAIRLRMCNR